MVTKNRKLWLLFLLPLAVPLFAVIVKRQQPCTNKIEVAIGVHAPVAGWRASLRQLSEEIKRCPKANLYIIRRRTAWTSMGSHATKYYRDKQVLQDDVFEAGSSFTWDKVNEKAIHAVAERGGTFDDLLKHGAVAASP